MHTLSIIEREAIQSAIRKRNEALAHLAAIWSACGLDPVVHYEINFETGEVAETEPPAVN